MGYETGFNATYESILEGAQTGKISPEQIQAVTDTFICQGPDDRYNDTAEHIAELKALCVDEPAAGLTLQEEQPSVTHPVGGAQPA